MALICPRVHLLTGLFSTSQGFFTGLFWHAYLQCLCIQAHRRPIKAAEAVELAQVGTRVSASEGTDEPMFARRRRFRV